MGRPDWPAALRSSISFRLFAILCVSVLGTFFVYAAVNNKYREDLTRDLLSEEAFRASSFIKQTLVAEIIDKQRDHIRRALRQLGGEPGMELIRIYNDRGEISFSSVETEVGQQLSTDDDACNGCHVRDQRPTELPDASRSRICTERNGIRVLGILNPILNAEGCSAASCHDPDQRVLGVLDVQLSMAGVDAAMRGASVRSAQIVLAIVLLAALLIALIVYNSVHVPASKLQKGTEALAAGNLDVSIDMDRNDELGQLAKSFNAMATNLKGADAELRKWSHTLEERVRQKTAELRAMSQQMIQVEKAASLGRMAATVAHELNNPLSGIVTYTKVIQRKIDRELPAGPDKEKIDEELDLIRAEGMRCGRIVQDLLTYARESPHEFRPGHLHELVERAVKLTEHHMALGSVRFETEFDLSDDRLSCDEDQIVQALLALLINGVEAMPEGGVITLETREPEGRADDAVVLRVRDSGPGIPDAIRGRIFDPFFSTKPESKGVGLGLAVVYGIVRRHDGSIRVQSEPAHGTTFHIVLPREPQAVGAAAATTGMDEWNS